MAVKYTYKIDSNVCLFGAAYEEALTEVAEVLNKHLGTKLWYGRDWVALEEIALALGVDFTANGEIVREV